MKPVEEINAAELADEVDEIYSFIKLGLDRDPQGLTAELDTRGQYLARSAEIVADAQVILDKKRGEVAEKHVGTEESWNIIKHLIEAECSDEKRLYVLAERLNATLTHQCDSIRTLLSFAKEEMRQTR